MTERVRCFECLRCTPLRPRGFFAFSHSFVPIRRDLFYKYESRAWISRGFELTAVFVFFFNKCASCFTCSHVGAEPVRRGETVPVRKVGDLYTENVVLRRDGRLRRRFGRAEDLRTSVVPVELLQVQQLAVHLQGVRLRRPRRLRRRFRRGLQTGVRRAAVQVSHVAFWRNRGTQHVVHVGVRVSGACPASGSVRTRPTGA